MHAGKKPGNVLETADKLSGELFLQTLEEPLIILCFHRSRTAMKKTSENQISIYKVMNVLDFVLKREQFINTFEVSGKRIPDFNMLLTEGSGKIRPIPETLDFPVERLSTNHSGCFIVLAGQWLRHWQNLTLLSSKRHHLPGKTICPG
jgi:hypothetical protein